MKIGISCYPTHGGSGVVATELGLELARRGHHVHFMCYNRPFRLERLQPNVYYHRVQVNEYPLFKYPPYSLALATAILDVTRREDLDLIHAHYAIPHSVSAWMAREMLQDRDLPIVTTLHGTDITLVGQEPSYEEITCFALRASNALTAVSEDLARATRETFCQDLVIDTIYNFVDTEIYRPERDPGLRARFAGEDEFLLAHASNFRPVKRTLDVIRIFARVARECPARLVLMGLGPDRHACEELARELGLEERVHFLDNQGSIRDLLRVADLFLLPSETESFGLVALEAMACGVPVIASEVGGLRELIDSGRNSWLCPRGDTEAFAGRAVRLFKDSTHYREISEAARQTAIERFTPQTIVPQYEAVYRRVIEQKSS